MQSQLTIPTRHKLDDEVTIRVRKALAASGYPQLQCVEAHTDHGRVTLQGRVTTYFLKQVAQSVVLDVEGVRDLDNDLKVNSCA